MGWVCLRRTLPCWGACHPFLFARAVHPHLWTRNAKNLQLGVFKAHNSVFQPLWAVSVHTLCTFSGPSNMTVDISGDVCVQHLVHCFCLRAVCA